jgi:cell division protein FtsB
VSSAPTHHPGPRPQIAINKARLGRLALIVLLLLMASSYVRPAIDWVDARATAGAQHERLTQLQATERRLEAEHARLSSQRGALVAARQLGLVHTGERAYVVRGLPGD